MWYQCKICKRFLATLKLLTLHTSKNHPNEFIQAKKLYGHQRSTLSNFKNSSIHQRPTKPPEEDSEPDDDPEGSSDLEMEVVDHEKNLNVTSYKCDQCHKYFATTTQLQTHSRVHTPQELYSCPNCPAKFNLYTQLTRHLAQCNPSPSKKVKGQKKKLEDDSSDTGEKVFENYTTKMFQGKKVYICTHCLTILTSVASIKQHVRIHTGEKPYVCSHCHKSFGYYSTWKNHERLHTATKTIKCPKCPKTFFTSKSKTEHIYKSHTKKVKAGKR